MGACGVSSASAAPVSRMRRWRAAPSATGLIGQHLAPTRTGARCRRLRSPSPRTGERHSCLPQWLTCLCPYQPVLASRPPLSPHTQGTNVRFSISTCAYSITTLLAGAFSTHHTDMACTCLAQSPAAARGGSAAAERRRAPGGAAVELPGASHGAATRLGAQAAGRVRRRRRVRERGAVVRVAGDPRRCGRGRRSVLREERRRRRCRRCALSTVSVPVVPWSGYVSGVGASCPVVCCSRHGGFPSSPHSKPRMRRLCAMRNCVESDKTGMPQQVCQPCARRKPSPSLTLPTCTTGCRAGDAKDTSFATGAPQQLPGVPGGGYAGVNGRASSPPGSTVIYTDDEDDEEVEFVRDDRCGGAGVTDGDVLASVFPAILLHVDTPVHS